jgi:hypothetical protein
MVAKCPPKAYFFRAKASSLVSFAVVLWGLSKSFTLPAPILDLGWYRCRYAMIEHRGPRKRIKVAHPQAVKSGSSYRQSSSRERGGDVERTAGCRADRLRNA